MGLCALVLVVACAVGESPPQAPPPDGVEGAPGGAAVDDAVPAADAAAAADLLERSIRAYHRSELEESLRLSREVLSGHAGTLSEPDARWVAARAAFALGQYEESRELALEHARRADAGSADAVEARSLAELAADAMEAPAPVVVGAVLSRSGPRVLVRYADWVLEGIQLAIAEAELDQNRSIELVVADDAGGARVSEAIRELERRGAVAIVGPMLDEHLWAAAEARSSRELVLVSPTSSSTPQWPETYSINSSDALGARELGRYAADVGLRQAAILHPRLPDYERKAEAFVEEFTALGGIVRAVVPYDSGTTTFAPHMRQILAAVAPTRSAGLAGSAMAPGAAAPLDSAEAELGQQPFALFVPAPPRDVPQIAPQLGFYGLDSAGVQLFGDEAWATAEVRRVVPDRDLEGVIAASRFPPERAEAAADPDFVRAYETRYRQSLGNSLPALGYDAAHLIMQALPNRSLTPAALARRFHLLAGIRGATGLLSVRSNRVVRRPHLVIIRSGMLEPVPYPWDYEQPLTRPPLPQDSAMESGR
jgi:ABC-type branched-subunit amino acid transport system substrate-binding protein